MSTNQDDAIEKLCNTYRENRQIGLILGAGVSKESKVPLYKGLAAGLVKRAYKELLRRNAPREALDFILELSRSGEEEKIDPEAVFQFVHEYIPEQRLLELIWKVIYKKVPPPHKGRFKMVAASTYTKNKTLDAIISFCSASPGSPFASGATGRWETNQKVGGILTTNYDNLVEGSFNSKYRKLLLKPVPLEGARETIEGKRVIPVYHMHGYFNYQKSPDKRDLEKLGMVIAEEDYYQTFYNLLGFSNVVAMSFMRRFPCIFIGCSMVDRNIRRILYHLRRERIHSSDINDHFAILPLQSPGEDEFDDAVLKSFGVTAIRVKKGKHMGADIEAILKQVYLSMEGLNDEKYWDEAKKGP
jgi:hypothetical protein